MADALYDASKVDMLDGTWTDWASGNVGAILYDVGAGGAFSASDTDYTDVSAGKVGTAVDVGGRAVLSDGSADCNTITFSSVTGSESEAVILYRYTGGTADSPTGTTLIAYIDSATNLPVTPNGGDISMTIDAAGLFSL